MSQSQFNFTRHQLSISDFILKWGPKVDSQPVGQRLDTENTLENKKSQGIIKSIMQGMNIGEITIHELENSQFQYESIDGGHRKRYIKSFFENRFRTEDGRYFSELTDEESKRFMQYQFTFVIYTELNVYDIGYIFRTLNETTKVNHQEELNSYGNIPIANAIREMVRPVVGINNRFHSLFDYFQRDPSSKKTHNLVSFNNHRLATDERVSRLFFRYYDGGGLGRADENALEELFQADLSQDDVDKLAAQVHNCLNFVEQIAIIRKRRNKACMGKSEFSLYTRIWLWMEETYGSFKINDYDAFYQAISTAMVPFNKSFDQQQKTEQHLAESDKFLTATSPYDANKTVGQQFASTLGEHRNRTVILETLLWMLRTVDMDKLVTLKDPRRLFPREWRENKLAEQNFKCYVTGKPLLMKDAAGGHIIAHSNGGVTEYDNLAMICSKVNQDMGTMSVENYKTALELSMEPA